MAAEWPGLEGMDLAKEVSRDQLEAWSGGKWELGEGYRIGGNDMSQPHVVAIDYGAKRNIFRNLVEAGARVTVLPATASFDEVMSHKPDGFFLSNGPGDPAATGEYAVPVIKEMLEARSRCSASASATRCWRWRSAARRPRCSRATAAPTIRSSGWRTAQVEITSMNHGFAVEREGLPDNVRETHVSLFDDSNCGIELTDRPAFSVQYHPEASPGRRTASICSRSSWG